MTDSMFGGGGLGYGSPLTSLFLRNPEMAAAYRRQQYAEALGQAGMSGEPIRSPWQGVNKLAQAGIAAMLMNRSDEEMTAAAQKQRDQEAAQEAQGNEFMQRALGLITPQGGGSPMSQALLNPNGAPVPPGAPNPATVHGIETQGSMQPGVYGDGGAAAGPMQVHEGALADVNQRLGTNYTHAQLASDTTVGKAVGNEYLKMQYEQFGDKAKAYAAYNAGPGRVAAAVKAYGDNWMQGIPEKSQAYVRNALARDARLGGDAGGNAGADGSMPTPPVPPGTPQAPSAPQAGVAPQPAGPQGAPTQAQYAALDLEIEKGRKLQALAIAGGASANPAIKKNAENMRIVGERMEARAIAERNRLDTLANRTVQHTIAQGPDGKNYIYEVTPNGLGKQLGMAPKQPGEPTGPFAGTGMDQQSGNVLLKLAPKIKDGTATEAEQGEYGLAYRHYADGDLKLVPDPSDPTGQRQMQARIPRDVPRYFPVPPGEAGQGGPSGSGPRVIPGTEKDTPMTTDQAKSAGYADRMQASNQIIGAKIDAGTSRMQRGAASIPLIGNSLVSADYQQLEQAQRDFINAKLRQESGAAIAESEFENARKQYFPQPGDGPEVIAQKARNRDLVIQGMAREAGKGYTVPKATQTEAPAIPPPPDGFKVVK